MPAILPGHAAPHGIHLMPVVTNEPLKIGEWLADPRDDSLTRGAEKVKIEPRTMRLLMRLAQTPGVVVSQEELLESVWSGVVVGTASIYQSMSQLRKVLGDNDDPPRYLETVARKGYRLVAPVAAAPANVRATLATAIEPAMDGTISADPPVAVAVGPSRQARWPWIALAAAATLAVFAAVWRFAPSREALPVSIAVMPFIDMTSGHTEQVFCDGLAEETSNWLAQVPTLRVVARTSAFSYRNRDADVRTIGRELRTNHLLEGSLRRSGNHLRITVQLIDTNTGYHIWSRSYDVEAGDDLSLEEQIARAVVGNLELRMSADVDGRLVDRRSRSAEAQRLYLIAKGHAQKFDAPSNEQAITLYRQALKVDPTFALAKVWLAQAIGNRRYFAGQPIEALAPEIKPLLDDVQKSAPGLTDLYVVRGGFLIEMRQRDAALRDLRHALELDPNSRAAASTLGFYHLTAAEPRDALMYYTMASDLDPRDFGMHAYRCMALADLAEFAEAEAACGRARALDPESPWAYSVTSSMESMRGRLAEALNWNDAALKRGNDIMAIQEERARWLLGLGLLKDAGAVVQRALDADAAATRANPQLMLVGAAAAIDSRGSDGLHEFLRDNGLQQSTEPALLFEAANATLMVSEPALARKLVDAALASKSLQPEDLASPWAVRTGQSYLLVAAAAMRASGDAAGAQQRLQQLAALLAQVQRAGVSTSGMYELEAQLAAMRGDGDAAMQALRRAVALGWSEVWLAEHQPYFEAIRARPDFRALLDAARARNLGTAEQLRARLSAALVR